MELFFCCRFTFPYKRTEPGPKSFLFLLIPIFRLAYLVDYKCATM